MHRSFLRARSLLSVLLRIFPLHHEGMNGNRVGEDELEVGRLWVLKPFVSELRDLGGGEGGRGGERKGGSYVGEW